MVHSHSDSLPTLGQELRICLGLATPLAAAQLAQMATGFIDTVMMGRLGSDAIAAGGLGAIAFNFLVNIATGIISAVSPLVAEAHGAQNPQRMRRIFQQGLLIALGLSLVMMAILALADHWLPWLGQPPETVDLTRQYLNAILWSCPPAFFFMALRSYVAAVSSPRPIMVIGIFGTAINAAGNYALSLGKFGFPALGLTGIGLASVLSFSAMALILTVYVQLREELRAHKLFNLIPSFARPFARPFAGPFPRQDGWELLRVGSSIGALHAVEGGFFTVATFLVSQFDTLTLAAHHIALQTAATTFMVAVGVSMAATIRVGHLMGRGQIRAGRRAGLLCIAVGAIFMGAMALLFWAAPTTIVSLYIDTADPANQAVVTLAKRFLGVAAVFQIMDGVQVTAAGALRGLKDTRIPLLIGIMAYWILGLPVGVGFAYHLKLAGIGYWWGMALGLMAAAVILTSRFWTLTAQRSLWISGSKI